VRRGKEDKRNAEQAEARLRGQTEKKEKYKKMARDLKSKLKKA